VQWFEPFLWDDTVAKPKSVDERSRWKGSTSLVVVLVYVHCLLRGDRRLDREVRAPRHYCRTWNSMLHEEAFLQFSNRNSFPHNTKNG
jgi:hypothetical protein